jgi:hypothetical protein
VAKPCKAWIVKAVRVPDLTPYVQKDARRVMKASEDLPMSSSGTTMSTRIAPSRTDVPSAPNRAAVPSGAAVPSSRCAANALRTFVSGTIKRPLRRVCESLN